MPPPLNKGDEYAKMFIVGLLAILLIVLYFQI